MTTAKIAELVLLCVDHVTKGILLMVPFDYKGKPVGKTPTYVLPGTIYRLNHSNELDEKTKLLHDMSETMQMAFDESQVKLLRKFQPESTRGFVSSSVYTLAMRERVVHSGLGRLVFSWEDRTTLTKDNMRIPRELDSIDRYLEEIHNERHTDV